MRLIDADTLVKILNDFWLLTSPREHDDKETALERAAMCRGIDDCIKYVHDAPTVGGWISVKERLPERKEYLHESNVIRNSSEYVLVYVSASFPYERMFVTVARYDYDKHWPRWVIRSSHDGVVTHWMPLPEPPKEEE